MNTSLLLGSSAGRFGLDRLHRFLICLLLFIGSLLPLAQAQCPSGNVTLTTQAEVDAFPPGCVNFPGTLTIRESSSGAITNLQSLSALQSITGRLNISNNDQLNNLVGLNNLSSIGVNLTINSNGQLGSLAGLNNLSSIGESINISSNGQLSSLSGLEKLTGIRGNLDIDSNGQLGSLAGLNNLTSIGGYLNIKNNTQLSSLTGLDNLSSLGNSLTIDSNEQLGSLAGLEKLTSIRTDLSINKNAQLSSLAGLNNITSIGGNLDIVSNGQLGSLAGLNNLSSIGVDLKINSNGQLRSLNGLSTLTSIGNLRIDNNDQLSNVSGLNNLTSIEGYLDISNNDQLSSLAGLAKLTSIVGNLTIFNNAQLSQCAIPPICQYLTNPKGAINIRNNAPGCQSQQEVQTNCLSINTQPASGSTVCAGASVTASVAASGNAPTYQWYKDGQPLSNQTSATLTLTNVQTADAGSYSVVVSNSVSSLTSTAFTLTVNPSSVSINPSTTAICQGQSARFSASGAASYQWRGPSSFTSTDNTITVSAPGAYSVTGSTSGGCSASATASLTVNNNPTVSLSSNGTLTCANTSVVLRAEPAGQGTYAFSGPGLNQISTTNQAQATRPGTYTVALTTAGGCSASATAEVSQNIAPPTGVSLSSSGTLSANNPTVTLTATSNATANVGVSYAFSPPAQKISDNRATVTTSGTYSVTATRADNGCAASATTTVLGAASTTACRGTSTTISLTPAGSPSRYEWYIGVAVGQPLRDGAYYQGTATANLRVMSVSQSQIYYAKVFYADGSSVVYGPYRVTLNTNCGAREAATVEPGESTPGTKLRLTVLGNPVAGDVLRAQVVGAAGQRLYVQLLDVKGHSVRSQVFESAESAQALEWNLNTSSTGIYLLQASTPTQKQTIKVVKP